jgi:antitoxin ParD1/3/4
MLIGMSTIAPPATIGFRPDAVDQRILAESPDGATATIRRALRLLDHEQWLNQARKDMIHLRNENVNDEPEAW